MKIKREGLKKEEQKNFLLYLGLDEGGRGVDA